LALQAKFLSVQPAEFVKIRDSDKEGRHTSTHTAQKQNQEMTNKHNKALIVIGGPTASGKTELAIRLARHFDTEILSCDSRQFFREMSIGTAKPTEEERSQAPHHFINNLSIQHEYSVGDYEQEALALLEKLYEKKEVAIMVGGSGLYQKAVIEGLDEFPDVPLEVRREVEQWYTHEGLEALQNRLREVDPDYYAEVDIHNPHRLIRALAVYEASGQAFSSFRKNTKSNRPFFPIYLALNWQRKVLYDRINRRVDLMMDKGLLEEAGKLYPFKHLTALQTVGYQELFDFLDGKISLEEAVALIKRNSRRYAKRQMTWSRRDGYWKHFAPAEWELILEYVQLAGEHQLFFQKNSPDTSEKIQEPSIDHKITLTVEGQRIADCVVSQKKYKIYRDFHINETYWGSREEFFFLHEIFQRLQNNDQVEVPSRLQPFFVEKGCKYLDTDKLTLVDTDD
jgi:tRNA dimethylallyltransferase